MVAFLSHLYGSGVGQAPLEPQFTLSRGHHLPRFAWFGGSDSPLWNLSSHCLGGQVGMFTFLGVESSPFYLFGTLVPIVNSNNNYQPVNYQFCIGTTETPSGEGQSRRC